MGTRDDGNAATAGAPKAPRAAKVAQAWIELLAEDAEAVSAFEVARSRVAAGREVAGLRMLRVMELRGALPTRPRLATLLHESIQFYNPHKERCAIRTLRKDPPPLREGERLVLVTERGGERRVAAERWWLHETGKSVEVREGVVWAIAFAPGTSAAAANAATESLATLRDRRHGLFANPHGQEVRIAADSVPLPWLSPEPEPAGAPSDEAEAPARSAATGARDEEDR